MPDHWQETTLDGLIARTIGGVWGADPGEDEVDVPIYRQTEFDDAGRLHQPAGAVRSITYRQLASRTLEENDVLIQKSAGTPTLPGRVVLVPQLSEASSFSNFLTLLRADRQAVEPVFLFLVLQHLHATKVAFEFQRGTNIRNLDLKSYLATTLLVAPLEEQRRIVDLVGSIDNHIDALQGQINATRTARQGVLSELLSNAGSDWNSSSISDLLTHTIGGIWGQEVGTDEVDASVIRSTNFTADGNPDLSDVAKRSVTRKQLAGRELQQGDILLEKSGGGPKQPVGRVLFIGQEMPQTVCANFVQLIRCNGERAVPRFLFLRLWLDHLTGLTQAFQAATTGIRNLRTKDYLLREIAVPPIEEQKRIVDLIESFDEQISALESQVDTARATRSGVLSELLSGDRLLDESYDKAVGW